MFLTDDQMREYERDGFLLIRNCLTDRELEMLQRELPDLLSTSAPSRILETNATVVRSVYGAHAQKTIFAQLCRLPRLLKPAMQLIKDEIYVYQFKINVKAAFDGDAWEWHQDYIFWQREDGMPNPRVINAAIYLDDVTEFNGPIYVLPGSQREGALDPDLPGVQPVDGQPFWLTDLTAKLKYSLDRATVCRLFRKYGISSTTGQAGSILFFDSNLVHASPNNISPDDRKMIIITYNSIHNLPTTNGSQRPEFLVASNFAPLAPIGEQLE
jgi:ectoine hydroxylase-related dioxygenase (phytanoyl-CoA dioxygenase family)